MTDNRPIALAWRVLLYHLALFVVAVILAASCSSGPDGVCSLDDNSTCPAGQVCRLGPAELTVCSCSVTAGTGCPGSQVCVKGADGEPGCVACALDTNAGCPAGKICAKDASGALGCFVCTSDGNRGCATGQVCLPDPSGAPGCFCDVSTKGGCEDGKVCLAGPNNVPTCYCNTETEGGCPTGQVCEEVPGDFPACFPPVTVGGMVFNLATTQPIAGAHVVARDANFAAVSGVAVTDAAGKYTLTIPAPRMKDGTPVKYEIFLRADAQGFVTFPTAPRVALPIDLSKATGTPPHLESSATDIGMITLPNAAGLGSVSGKVLSKVPVGTLVVAGGATNAGGGVTGIADTNGSYTVFNVPAGPVTVRGYKVGDQLASATATVTAGADTPGVDLADTGVATAVVSGSVNIVNPGNGSTTSVILVVDETFDPNAARGEAPPGLRIAPVSNAFSITGVPDGNYVVLAAFENDYLVRDPDTSIGGTQIVHITVAGQNMAVSTSFKVTGSLDHPKPTGEEVVSGTPTFTWDDDSGEDHYEVRVFDAYGTKVWEDLAVPKVTGSAASLTYGGPALTSGTLYQWRATSIKNGGSPLSVTEDLMGVFLYK